MKACSIISASKTSQNPFPLDLLGPSIKQVDSYWDENTAQHTKVVLLLRSPRVQRAGGCCLWWKELYKPRAKGSKPLSTVLHTSAQSTSYIILGTTHFSASPSSQFDLRIPSLGPGGVYRQTANAHLAWTVSFDWQSFVFYFLFLNRLSDLNKIICKNTRLDIT